MKTHYTLPDPWEFTLCGARLDKVPATTVYTQVTCKRCLNFVAKYMPHLNPGAA